MTDADAAILAQVRAAFGATPPARLGIAVSGGGDSVALLHILSRCFPEGGVELFAATVDHGLRPAAAQEAAAVARLARNLGVAHSVLRWQGWDGSGNLQDQARRARYRLLADWAGTHGIAVLVLGHTADDQAETVLMRLARSSGVTGLAGMAPQRALHGITMMRPLLDLTRAQLRGYLTRNGIAWAEDPSNDDDRFERVRMRKALDALEPLGLTVPALAGVARNMAQARDALDWYSWLAARDLATADGGDVVFDSHKFRDLPDEIARRLLVRAIGWIGGGEYPPRRAPIRRLVDTVRGGGQATLGGCRILCRGPSIRVFREYNAVAAARCAPGGVWDRRWRVHGGDAAGCEVRALGQGGLAQCDGWTATGRPRASLAASPAVWRDDDLVAAPLAGRPEGWRAELVGGGEEFFASLLSH